MRITGRHFLLFTLTVPTMLYSMIAQAADFDTTPAWPLCGRIAESPPAGWTASQGCPADRWGNAEHSDLPLASTFGPRQLVSDNYRYDFHRGIDIEAPVGTPVFAIADGQVRIAGPHSAYSDPLIQLRHFRPGAGNSCTAGNGCYHSNYMHLSNWVVSAGDTVSKGQLLGYTGLSQSGFAHLHFEIRNAPASDPFSAWQRDAIHPLSVLAYDNGGPSLRSIDNLTVDASNPANPVVSFTISQPTTDPRLDLARVEVKVFEKQLLGSLQEIDQPGATADSNGYHLTPPWMDFTERNFYYSHKNSSDFPWSSFANCPHQHEHGSSYDAGLHLDRASPANYQVGDFNGVEASPEHFNASALFYQVGFRFKALTGTDNADSLCVRAIATDVQGMTTVAEHNCELLSPLKGKRPKEGDGRGKK